MRSRWVYEVDPVARLRCGGRVNVVGFLVDCAFVDRIIRHHELMFTAERPPHSRIFARIVLTEVEGFGDFSIFRHQFVT